MSWPCIQLQDQILQLHFVSYSSGISTFLQKLDNSQKWILYQWVNLPNQHLSMFSVLISQTFSWSTFNVFQDPYHSEYNYYSRAPSIREVGNKIAMGYIMEEGKTLQIFLYGERLGFDTMLKLQGTFTSSLVNSFPRIIVLRI